MDYPSEPETKRPLEVLNKPLPLPVISNNKDKDFIIRSSFKYQKLVFHRNTGKYEMESGSHDYINFSILGKTGNLEKELCATELTEKDSDLLKMNSTNYTKCSKMDKSNPKSMKIRAMKSNKSRKHQKTKYNYYFYRFLNIVFISVLVIILSKCILTWISTESKFLENLERELSTKVLNQNTAINTLNRSINKLYEQGNSKILTCLVGSTGVGKTYSINILQEFVDPRIIHVFHSSDLSNFVEEQGSAFSRLRSHIISSDHNIVVFDDLKINHLKEVQRFIQIITKIEEVNILLIVVFNIQNTDTNFNVSINHEDSSAIKENLEILFQHFYFAQFNKLNETVIKAWLKNKLVSKNILEKYHERIINELLNIQDIDSYGLKGMHSKLLLESHKNVMS